MNVWRQSDGAFQLMRGPVFTNVLLTDEINRAPPKTPVRPPGGDGGAPGHHRRHDPRSRHALHRDCSRRNPIEQEGTYPLPEAQLDRLPPPSSQRATPPTRTWRATSLLRRIQWQKDDPTEDVEPAVGLDRFVELQQICGDGRVHGRSHSGIHHAHRPAVAGAPARRRRRQPARRPRPAPRRPRNRAHPRPRLRGARRREDGRPGRPLPPRHPQHRGHD